ncbi:MAG TPA: flagellar type III secretion system pore protein FliP [Gemmatimonadaceae bacterium]|nr:flagellar type III secretion system pore protein FliP [Gemmatimonadaceae bacterium]
MFAPLLGVVFSLGLVLLLLGITLRLLRRVMPGAVASRTAMPMQVVQRLSLSPRQGIAFVRAGSRVVAVSVGDGGVRRLFELDEDEASELLAARGTAEPSFQGALAKVMRRPEAPAPKVPERPATVRPTIVVAPPPRSRTIVSSILLILAALAGAAAFAPLLAQAATPAAAVAPPGAAVAAPGRANAAPTAPNAAPAGTVAAPAGAVASPTGANPVESAAQVVTRLAPQLDVRLGTPGTDGTGGTGGLRLSGTVGVVVMLGLLTLLPTLVLMMTSFTRILLVLHFVKQGVGAQTGIPNQLIAALALILTFFVMGPTLAEVNRDAITPWMEGRIEQAQMLEIGAKPLRAFMLRQTRPSDVRAFVRMSGAQPPASLADVPLVTLMSAFATSELRTAFAIGFAVMLPFLVIDVVVSSTLMSMGFAMLPPAMVSLPFKLLLFVLVDGWSLVMQSLVASFR